MFNKLFKKTRYKIGNTPLVSFRQLESLYGFPNLLVKDESRNSFGTFKDRRNVLVIDKALESHADKVALITSGNSGYSLARLARAQGTGVKVVCIIDKDVDPYIKQNLRKHSYSVFEVNLQSRIFQTEDVVKLAREDIEEVIWDVTNGYHEAFQSIVSEIRKEEPDWLITPVGSGEAFVGLYEGLRKYRMKTKLVGAGVHSLHDHQLELFAGPSIADKLFTPYTPYKARIEEILRAGHYYIQLSDKQIKNAYEMVRDSISCEPSAAATFGALSELGARASELSIRKESKVIIVNSGKGSWGSIDNHARNISSQMP
jgi:threonine synthase